MTYSVADACKSDTNFTENWFNQAGCNAEGFADNLIIPIIGKYEDTANPSKK